MKEEAMMSSVNKTRGGGDFTEIDTLRYSTSVVPELLEKSLKKEPGESSENEENLKSTDLTVIKTENVNIN